MSDESAKTPPAESLRLVWMSPSDLADNPRNWRRHPPLQAEAVGASLDEVGWAGACLLNERTGRIVDGHLRKAVALEKGVVAIPVLVGDWDEATEAKILATLDPLAALAEIDVAMLDSLLRDVETGNSALATLLSQLAEDARSDPDGEAIAAAIGAPVGVATGDGGGGAGDPEGSPCRDGKSPFLLEVSCPTEARRNDLMASLRADGYDCVAR